MIDRVRRIGLLAFLAYVPLLASAPGRIPGDTKLYLYLDPGRLISDSIWSWDARQLGGWVPHQNVGYLWPSGPFYALFDAIGTPDWIAHRLWIGTLLLLAGSGVFWLCQRLRLGPTVGLSAAIVYQLSPYVLPYISRTSALLLPWALLGWLVGVTIRVAERRDPRDIGLFGLLVLSTGGLNATALAMIAPGPLIWLFAAARGQSRKRVVTTLAVLGAVAIGASAWWMAGLRIQGAHGAAVLSYSETLPSTAATSTSLEVLRGLGYWLFYDRNHVVDLTSGATPYMGHLVVMIAGVAIAGLGFRGLLLARREIRRPLVAMLLVGAVLAIGAYPFDDPSLLWRAAADNPTSALSLALRSSTRAVPLVILALAIGAGLSIERFARRRFDARAIVVAPALALVLAVANLPALVGGRLVDPVMERPNDLPTAWTDAARFLNERYDAGNTGSVLLVPGIESAAYRWGYTVDPILPGLTKKRLVTRDWLPLGSAPYMDLLYALDDAFQNGDIDVAAVAPVARLLGADTIMVVNSYQYERFGTVSPGRTATFGLDGAPGLSKLADFGEPTPNASPFWSADDTIVPPVALPEISLYAVENAGTADRVVKNPTLVLGDGTGLVDIAPVVNGPVLAAAALDDISLERALTTTPEIVVTDSNRRRAHHWRSSQEVWGATEPPAGVLTVADVFDQRLPVFPDQTLDDQTYVEPSDLVARATAYGYELTFRPESRPSMAIDGDPTTAWVVGERRDPRGQTITLESESPVDSLELVAAPADRTVTRVSVRVDDGRWNGHDVSSNSRIVLDPAGRRVEVRIDDVSPNGSDAVGWSEMLPSDRTRPEILRVPRTSALPESTAPLSWIFTRLVADSNDPWRSDPETAIRRVFDVPRASTLTPDFTVRVRPQALDTLPLVTPTSTLARSINGFLALDGRPDTAWYPSTEDSEPGLSLPVVDGELRVTLTETDGVDLIARTDDGVVRVESVGAGRFAITTAADRVTLLPVRTRPVVRRDSRTGEPVTPPLGIVEVSGSSPVDTNATFTIDCRGDLVSIDGRELPITITGTLGDAIAGHRLAARPCSPNLELDRGDHRIDTVPGHTSGIDVERVVLRSTSITGASATARVSTVVERGTRRFTLPACPDGCWLETRDGWNTGWSARSSDLDLGEPVASGGGRTTWWVEPGDTPRVVTATWTPQRTLWIGLAVSLLTALICLVLVARRRRTEVGDGSFAITESESETIGTDSAPRRLAIVTAVITAIVVSPLWALLPLALIRRRFSLWALRVGGILLGLAALFMMLQQIRTGADPGFGWPSVFRRAHRPALAGLVLVVMGSWGDPRRRVTNS